MNLRWEEFEQRLKKRVAIRVALSSKDWEEYRRYGWWQKLTQVVNIPGWFGRIVICLMLIPLSLSWGRFNPNFLAGAMLVWVTLNMAWCSSRLAVALQNSPRLLVFGHLPMTDVEIFQQQWKSHVRTSMGAVVDFAILFGILAGSLENWWWSVLTGLVLALAQFLVVLSISVLFVAYLWNRRVMGSVLAGVQSRGVRLVRRILIPVAVLLALTGVIGVNVRHFTQFAVLVPFLGLVYELLGLGGHGSELVRGWTSLSAGAVLMAMPLAYRRLKLRYRLPEGLLAGEREVGQTEAARRREVTDETEDPCAEIKATIRNGEFLKEADWRKAGWVEGLTARSLNRKEKVTADFLFAGAPGWTRAVKRLALVGIGCVAVWFVYPRIFSAVGFFVPFFIVALTRGKNPNLSWPGAQMRTVSGSNIAMCSVYPVGFWRMVWLSLKIRLLHFGSLLMVLGVPAIILLCASQPGSIPNIISYGARILVLLLAVLFLMPISMISQGTNDATTWHLIAVWVPCILLGVASTVTMFVMQSPWGYSMAGLGLLLEAVGGLFLYGHAYNHDWFDLQRKPQTRATIQLTQSR